MPPTGPHPDCLKFYARGLSRLVALMRRRYASHPPGEHSPPHNNMHGEKKVIHKHLRKETLAGCGRRMRRLGVAGMAAMFILAQAASAAAEEPRKIELDLASQPLYNALQTFAEMLDYQLLVRDKDISTRIAPPLRGVYTVDEALSILLKGSGLKYEVDASGLIVVGQNSEPRQRLIAAQESETIGGAMAQSASQPGGGQSLSRLAEIVVTAQKRAQSINDVGITINAFTGDMLRDRGIRSADEMALVTPGLTINESFTNGVPVYTIRGVGFSDYSAGASSTVGLYFDE